VFVTDPDQVPTDATPFDMRGVELSHHHGDCTFETILRRYELSDPVLWRIAEIVHEACSHNHRADSTRHDHTATTASAASSTMAR
jgi:hypothetical protein